MIILDINSFVYLEMLWITLDEPVDVMNILGVLGDDMNNLDVPWDAMNILDVLGDDWKTWMYLEMLWILDILDVTGDFMNILDVPIDDMNNLDVP